MFTICDYSNFRVAKPKDAELFRDTILPHHILDLEATAIKDIYVELEEAIEGAVEAHLFFTPENEPAFLTFILPPEFGHFCIGAVGTVDMLKHKKLFLKHCRQVCDYYADKYKKLVTVCRLGNKNSQRWLRWLGFMPGTDILYGTNKQPLLLYFKQWHS